MSRDELLGVPNALRTTFKHLLKRNLTVEYPEEKIPLAPRFRGAPVWAFDEGTGRARCVGCGLCVQACPKGVIEMRTTNGPGGARFVVLFPTGSWSSLQLLPA